MQADAMVDARSLAPVYEASLPTVDWMKNSVVYEVNTRQFNAGGTFNSLAPEIPRLKNLGVDVLWFMPIYPIGQLNRKGGLGSYYSIKNYHGVNPEFGNLQDFKNVVNAAHAQGMKVILDWVATTPPGIILGSPNTPIGRCTTPPVKSLRLGIGPTWHSSILKTPNSAKP